MKLEIEQKYPLSDPAEIEARLLALGGRLSPPSLQLDRYFAHPLRDFAHTDEALRIRSVESSNCLTYKGPKLGEVGKARVEINLSVAPGLDGAADCGKLLEALGFRPAADVCKMRRQATLAWQGRTVVAALDDVAGLGTYLELELLAEADQLDACQTSLSSLSNELHLSGSERRSYLELLLARQA